MQRAMIDAMIATLEDPFTQYMSPLDQSDFNKELSGNYVGIGAEVNFGEEWLTIVSPMDGLAGAEGRRDGGRRRPEIEGESYAAENRPVDECVDLLTGEAGTGVDIGPPPRRRRGGSVHPGTS